jgi:hypothetical protein
VVVRFAGRAYGTFDRDQSGLVPEDFDYVAHFLVLGRRAINRGPWVPTFKGKRSALVMGTHETKSTNDLSTRPARVVAMQSSLSYVGLPEHFGEALLLFALILLLSPYLAGTDLGFIKIPEFNPIAKRRLLILGPIAMVAAVLLHVPLVPKEETSKAVACSISGFVFDSDSNKPLSAVWVDLYRDLTSIQQRPALLNATVATTGPDGKFSFDCGGIKESQYPLMLAVRHEDWRGTRITGPIIKHSGEWSGINIPIRMSDVELVPLRELPVTFSAKKVGTDWFLTGDIENRSERSFPCIRLTYQMVTSYQDRLQGEPVADLGTVNVEIRNLGPHDKRSYQSKLPKNVGVTGVSKQECR